MAPARLVLGFFDFGIGYPLRISGRHRGFMAGLTPLNLKLDFLGNAEDEDEISDKMPKLKKSTMVVCAPQAKIVP